MEKLKNLERVTLKELEKLDSAYEGKNEFTEADAKKFDMLAHAWKSLLTAIAMHEANEGNNNQSFTSSPNSMRRPYYDNRPREMGDGWSGHYPPPWYPQYSRGTGWEY